MATPDFEIIGQTVLDGSGLKQGISAMTVAGGQMLADFAENAVQQLGRVFQTGVDFNASMEMYTTNFTTMLNGNAEAAQQLVGELQELGASTPLVITDLANAAQTLLNFNAADADNMTDTLRMLGDVALGDANKLQALAVAYGQMTATGRLNGQDKNQMINAGFNPLQELSEMGYGSMAELEKQMSKGAITVEMVQEAFKHATSEGGKFFNATENASRTFTGQMSTLKDKATALTGALTEDLFGKLSEDVLPAAIDLVQQFSDAFAQDGLSGMLDLGGNMVADLVTGLAESAPDLLTQGTDLAIGLIDSLASGVTEGIPQLLGMALPMMLDFSASIRENAGNLVDSGINLILNLMQGLMDSLPTLLAYVPQIVINLAGVINDNAPKILAMGIKLIGKLITGIIQAIPSLIQAAPKIVEAVVSVIRAFNWLQLGKTIIDGFCKGIKIMIGAVKEAGGNVFKGIWNVLKDLPSKLWGLAKDAVKKVVDAFTKKNWWEIGGNIIKGIMSGITHSIADLARAAAEAALNALNAAKHALGIHSPSRKARDEIGKPFSQGIAVGVEDNAEEAARAAQDSAENMVTAARRAVIGNQSRTADTITATGTGTQAALNASWHGESTTIIEMDGREVARATAPYIDEQLDL